MKKSQLILSKPIIYAMALIFAAAILVWGLSQIQKTEKAIKSAEIDNFIITLNNNLKEQSLRSYDSVKEISLALPANVGFVCFIDKKGEYDNLVNMELNKAKGVYTDKNLFFFPERYFPSSIENFELSENPLCISTINGKVKLRLTAGANVALISPADAADGKKECTSIIYNGNPEKRIDVVFLGEGYDKINEFNSDINSYINNVFIRTEPFYKNKNLFNFYRIDSFDELGCEIKGYIKCDDYKAKLKASSCPNDFIFILTERSKIKDMISPVRSAAFSNSAFINTADNEFVLIHEFAHIFSKLADEYVDEDYYKDFNIKEFPNCDIAGCSKWQIITDSCFEGCSLNSFYRSSENSIMRNYYKSKSFGIVNENIINKKMEAYR